LEPNDDEDLACFFCTLPRCEQRFPVAGGGQSKLVGVHNSCADKHMDKIHNPPKSPTEE
jgi:hypothetical protein